MRSVVLLVATVIVLVFVAFAAISRVSAQVPVPTMSVTIFGETNDAGRQVFEPENILIPQVPIILVVTFHNNDTMNHTFTIDDVNRTKWIDTGTVTANQSATVNFTVDSMERILLFNGTAIVPEEGPNGILFYCIPHRGTGVVGQSMVGQIRLASVSEGEVVDKGILLRAYWIGMIGIVSMLAWIGISYFIIKSSSRHFSDHREHVRKGLP